LEAAPDPADDCAHEMYMHPIGALRCRRCKSVAGPVGKKMSIGISRADRRRLRDRRQGGFGSRRGDQRGERHLR
jgi:hypothetical protein